ncbi:putative MFS family arabinose efflux permease [Povalibacter uvarum]|uniref:Putative MFS family arabinose efflux permease n=1 Tax=Povalibacter uvarum TaxID=732238 RepID=A0A841HUI1_9GAMM|nr:MFS transporter [Povalibacter uvarum]MBB6096473.1 putative MFS family arabinose efflux permease [Povalibacter uvarum]
MSAPQTQWDTNYEWKAVTLLTLGFGLVGLDRWIIAPLFPSMMQDLGLDYQALGNLIGALGLAWGVFAIVAGGLSDRLGRRKILVPAILAFSLLSGLSGFAHGIASLLVIRALMGITEGSFCPTSFAATADASLPTRRGFNLGVQQSAFPLFGLALGPIIATQLLQVVNWRWVFVIVAIPGLILGFLLWKTIREPATVGANAKVERAPLKDLMNHRNVKLGMLALMCAMSGIFVLSAMTPNYLVDYLKLTTVQMGFVTSAIGFGGFAGQVVLPGASDLVGRKNISLIGFALGAGFLYAFMQVGPNPVLLFALLFVCTFFCFGLLGLITGPIAAEAAPRGLISSTAGIIIGTGEIFGGGIAPAIAGNIAQTYGIQHVLTMALIGLVAGFFVSIFLVETAPRKVSALNAEAPAA